MRAREFYKKYRHLIEELAHEPGSDELWLTDLRALLHQFEDEAATLEPGSARLSMAD